MDIIKLKEAKDKGLTYYYTGKPCKHGHDSVRLVKGGSCRECKNLKAAIERSKPEYKQKSAKYHHERHKKLYTTEKRREKYNKDIVGAMWYRAKKRAERRGIEFSIKPSDIIIPDVCPILGITINKIIDGKKETSPSLDRKDAKVGYTKENIAVISNRANRIKSDATLEEITKIMEYMKGIQ
jgi:hypothetical protein